MSTIPEENEYIQNDDINDINNNRSYFSRFQSTLSIDEDEEKSTVIKRKDPQYNENRFKFTLTEDKILLTEVLQKIKYDQSKLKDFDGWQNLQDNYFQKRPILELARRCIELIRKCNSDQQKRFKSNNNFEEQKIGNSSFKIFSKPLDEEEKSRLIDAVEKHGENNWKEIANYFNGRTSNELRYKYFQIAPDLVRTRWTVEEDIKLMIGVNIFNNKSWSEISEIVFDRKRSDVQCRERYVNILDPNINLNEWTSYEDQKLREFVHQYGKQWSTIQALFEGKRTDNQIKRRYTKLQNQEQKVKQKAFNKNLQKRVLGKRKSLDENVTPPQKQSEMIQQKAPEVKQEMIQIKEKPNDVVMEEIEKPVQQRVKRAYKKREKKVQTPMSINNGQSFSQNSSVTNSAKKQKGRPKKQIFEIKMEVR